MNLKAVIEGLLFVCGEEGLTIEDIVDITEQDKNIISRLLKELYDDYDQNDRGMHIEFLGNKFKFTTKSEHKYFYKKLIKNEENSILSQSALETLAIIAYNGPIARTQIDEIRGVNSSYIIRKLLLKNLIKESGRAELPGKPITYTVTSVFLDHFGLGSINELPKIDLEQINNCTLDDNEKDLFSSKYCEE